MVVQHNLTAMNSNRMLGVTTSAQAKTTEKLSSGYRINRAADDASGLAISEKMRKQIRGLTQASANAQDGISAVQTAEGALTEVHDMLQRMNELAVKSANGTNSESDRSAIQAEVDQLVTEIDRVAETTKFNETYLLKGDATAKKGYTYSYNKVETAVAASVKEGTNAKMTDTATGLGLTVTFKNTAASASQNLLASSIKNQGVNVSYVKEKDVNTGSSFEKYTLTINGQASDKFKVVAGTNAQDFIIQDNDGNTIATAQVDKGSASGDNINLSANIAATKVTAAYTAGENYQLYDKDGNAISANGLNEYFSSTTSGTTVTAKALADASLYDAVGNRQDLTTPGNNASTKIPADMVASKQDVVGKLQVGLHVGADATSNNQITMNIEAMTAKGLGIVGLRVDGDDDKNALGAIETIKAAIQKVSAQRSDLGAIQNRLEHTISNLDNVVENTTSAESAIRDTDMATTMVQYSNNNILSQAGTSMLAQANQSNQSVLSLLQ